MNEFLELVEVERQKQIDKHGYTPEHDDKHADGSIADAGACYGATVDPYEKGIFSKFRALWKWDFKYFKKRDHDRKEQLVIGAAFYMAEYERLKRLEQQ